MSGKIRTRRVAPRLNGAIRVSLGSSLDPLVKHGLRMRARREGRSMSWIVEDILIEHFHFRHHERIRSKVPLPEPIE